MRQINWIPRFSPGWVALVCLLTSAALAEDAAITVRQPFDGVRYIQRTQREPRPLSIHLVEIDLTHPDVRFMISPSNGDEPGESTRKTTSAFVAEAGAQIGINASFFYKTEQSAPHVDNRGLIASNGEVYSPFEEDGRPWPVFNLTQDNHAQVFTREQVLAADSTDPLPLYNAVSGSERIVADGRNIANNERYGQPAELHPRTAIGVTNTRKLILMVVDGRQPGFSEGMTTPEAADLLISYGVIDAINLDGGGSSTMVIADHEPRIVNRPSDGSPRPVAACLAVFAAPATHPASTEDPTP